MALGAHDLHTPIINFDIPDGKPTFLKRKWTKTQFLPISALFGVKKGNKYGSRRPMIYTLLKVPLICR